MRRDIIKSDKQSAGCHGNPLLDNLPESEAKQPGLIDPVPVATPLLVGLSPATEGFLIGREVGRFDFEAIILQKLMGLGGLKGRFGKVEKIVPGFSRILFNDIFPEVQSGKAA